MQNSSTITFRCPSCNIKLQTPVEMAGISGPCPKCSTSIAAPFQEPQQPTETPFSSTPQEDPKSQPELPATVETTDQRAEPTTQPDYIEPQVQEQRLTPPRKIKPAKTSRDWKRIALLSAALMMVVVTAIIIIQAVSNPDTNQQDSGDSQTAIAEKTDSPSEPTDHQDIKPPSEKPAPNPEPPSPSAPITIPTPAPTPAPTIVSTPAPVAAPKADKAPVVHTAKKPENKLVDGEFPELQLPPPAQEPKDD